MSVGQFSHQWRAEFRIVEDGIYATIASRFSNGAETIDGIFEKCSLVGSVEQKQGHVSAVKWSLISTERSTTVDRTDLHVLANTSDELMIALNEKFGCDQEFIETLL